VKYTTKYINDYVPNSFQGTANPQFYSICLNPVPPQGSAQNSRIGDEYTLTSLRCRLGLYPIVQENNLYIDQLIRVMVIKIKSDMIINDGSGIPSNRTFPLDIAPSTASLTNQVDYISANYNVEFTRNIKIMYDKTVRIETGALGVQLLKLKFKMHRKMEAQDGQNTNDLIYFILMSDYRQSGAPEKNTVKFAFECKQSYTDS